MYKNNVLHLNKRVLTKDFLSISGYGDSDEVELSETGAIVDSIFLNRKCKCNKI